MRIGLQTFLSILIVFLFMGFIPIGCTSSREEYKSFLKEQLPNRPATLASSHLEACLKWTKELGAHISHVHSSADGRYILLSTSGEKKTEAAVRLLNMNGKILWTRWIKQPIKSQSVSETGDRLAINSYDSKLKIYNPHGALLWERDHLGRPVFFNKARRLLMLNDDDADPQTAFVVYDWNGKLQATAKLEDPKDEAVEIYTATDESAIAVALKNQTILFYDQDGFIFSKHSLKKDVVSIGMQRNGINLFAYVLSTTRSDQKQQLTVLQFDRGNTKKDVSAKVVSQIEFDRRYETLKPDATNGRIWLYGNTKRGQAIASAVCRSGSDIKLEWEKSLPFPANYSYLTSTTTNSMTIAIEPTDPAGVTDILGISSVGDAIFQARVPAESGLFSYTYASNADLLVAGAGDPGKGKLFAYQVKQSCR